MKTPVNVAITGGRSVAEAIATGTLCAVKTTAAALRRAGGTRARASSTRSAMAAMKSGWAPHAGAKVVAPT